MHTIIKYMQFRFIFCHSSVSGSWGQQLEQGDPDAPLPGHFHQLLQGDTGGVWYLQYVLGLLRGLLLDGDARNTSPGRHPGGILNRCPNHLNWLLSTWRSSDSSTLSLFRMSELLTLSLKLSPATLWRKAHFGRLYSQFRAFGHYPELITIGESWDICSVYINAIHRDFWLIHRFLSILENHRTEIQYYFSLDLPSGQQFRQ